MDDLSDVTPPADELNDERYPSLYNISPAFFYRFIPVPMGERRQVLESGGDQQKDLPEFDAWLADHGGAPKNAAQGRTPPRTR